MKKLLLLLLVASVIVSTGLSQGTGSASGDITTTITNMEQKVVDAIKNADWETLESYLGDEYLGVYGMGISNRSEELESFRNIELSAYDMSDVQVMQPSENVAIIAYKVSAEGSYMDEDVSGNYYSTTTWVNDGTTWKAVMHTESKEESMQGGEHDHETEEDSGEMETDIDSGSL